MFWNRTNLRRWVLPSAPSDDLDPAELVDQILFDRFVACEFEELGVACEPLDHGVLLGVVALGVVALGVGTLDRGLGVLGVPFCELGFRDVLEAFEFLDDDIDGRLVGI